MWKCRPCLCLLSEVHLDDERRPPDRHATSCSAHDQARRVRMSGEERTMNRQVAAWALASLIAGGAPMAWGQSTPSDTDQGDAGVSRTKPKKVRSKDAPSDVRDLDPTERVPSEQTTDTGTKGTKKKKASRKPAPSDVRSLDPAREVPSEQNTNVGASGAKRPKDSDKPAPSDVRELDPTRQVPGTESPDAGR